MPILDRIKNFIGKIKRRNEVNLSDYFKIVEGEGKVLKVWIKPGKYEDGVKLARVIALQKKAQYLFTGYTVAFIFQTNEDYEEVKKNIEKKAE